MGDSPNEFFAGQHRRFFRHVGGIALEGHAVLDLALDVVDVARIGTGFVGFDEEGMVVSWEAGFDDAEDLVGHDGLVWMWGGKGKAQMEG